MKLIRCYIENFGVLHQYSLNFEQGMTTLCQENGTGKSTLTMFLQAMFYGFPRAHKSLEKDLRRKYKPWQGGEYGGFLIFEAEGETYRLERYFGDRPNQDSFALFTLNPLKPSNRYDKDLGIALFGLDEESYARTSFIPQQMLGADLTAPGITAGLTTLVENTEDVHRYEHAMEALRQKRSALLPYRGQGGKLGQLTERMSQLQDSAYRLEQAKSELPLRIQEKTELEVKLADLQEELDWLQDKINETNEGIWMQQLHEQYQRMYLESERLTLAIQAMNISYPRGFPEPEAVEDALDAIGDADQSILIQDQEQLTRLKHNLELTRGRYEKSLPEPEELEQMQDQFREILQNYEQLEQNQNLLQVDHEDYNRREAAQKKMGLYLVVSTVSLIIAFLLFYFHAFIPGAICLALGLFCLLSVLFSDQKQEIDLSEEKALLDAQTTLRSKIRQLEESLSNSLLQYFPETSSVRFPVQLQQLSYDLNTLRDGKLQTKELEERIEARKQRIQAARNKLKVFCQQYSLPPAAISYKGLMQIKEEHIRFQNLQEDYRTNNNQMSDFLIEHGPQVTEAVTVNPRELPGLKDRLRRQTMVQGSLQTQLAEVKQLITQLTNKADQLPGILDQITALKETKENYTKEVRHLDLAMEHLKNAREGLTESYLKQIKDAFVGYCSQLQDQPIDSETCFISTDLSLSLDRQGAARELSAFSAGSTDLYRFCMRLALVDALYPKHKPMLILDDPFVNLDEAHAQKALQLLQSMQDQQILYLTCHQSRV